MYKPVYIATPEIVTAISQISEIKSDVRHARVLPLNEAQLRRQAIVRMAHTSTSIEGNKLAEYQVDKVLSGMSVNADQRSILEVKNYQAALIKIEQLAKDDKPLTINVILELHAILMKDLLPKEKVGHFRPGSIYIVDDLGNGQEVLRFEGPEASKVPHLVNELLKWLITTKEEKIHPIIKAAIFHIQFVSIHPFSDGNGRITRLLSTLLLYKDGWDFKKVIVLEDYYNTDRQEYYNSLNVSQGHKYGEGKDITEWIDYFVMGFLIEARKASDQIRMIGFNKSETEEPVLLGKDEMQIMDLLNSKGRVTSSEVEELLKVAKRTAQLKLKNIVDKKLVALQGKGPSSYYILKE